MSERDDAAVVSGRDAKAVRGRPPEAGRLPHQSALPERLRHLTCRFGCLLLVAGWAPTAPGAGGGPDGAGAEARAQRVVSGGEGMAPAAPAEIDSRAIESLRAAIEDLGRTFGGRYSRGPEFLARLEALGRDAGGDEAARAAAFEALRREALLANPLLEGMRLLVVKRKPASTVSPKGHKGWWSKSPGIEIGMPSNHECNSSLNKDGHDNEIAVLSEVSPDGAWRTLHRPANGGYAGEVDLNWDGERLLFTQSDPESWKIWEIRADGTGLRQVTRMPPDVDCMDPCYLPGGKILFGSTASYQSVPCWHGLKWVSNLYEMEADGTGVRQVCFDQDHDLHPVVLPNGQVMYSRWDYTGINHIYLRMLMVMNPDGTGQRAVYGSNSWYPNALYFPRALPGAPNRLACILSGYHGPHRMGQLVLLDTGAGYHDAAGIVTRISGRGDPIRPEIRDFLVADDWPRFLHPFPLSEKYFLVACQEAEGRDWGIYLADAFDNLVPVKSEPGWALLEPVPLRPSPKPPVIPSRIDVTRDDALVYIHDVQAGPGLKGVPRGTIKGLRVVAYNFGYRGLAGPDKIGRGGPWEAMRVIGTVPVEEDGSAVFRVPARTPLSLQALDAEGKAVQLMRSWFSAQPGENVSCVGCHETPRDAVVPRVSVASRREPRDLDPWYGPARGLDFAREVQPVLDRHCVSCHDGSQPGMPDLRPEEQVPGYKGMPLTKMGIERLYPEIREATGGVFKYTPAYEALLGYVRRVGIEDDVNLLVPGEYHADVSPLIQMLKKGHGGVRLGEEDWSRLVTWIDLNAPCHGTWGEVFPIPRDARARRMEMRRQFGGPKEDPEVVPEVPRATVEAVAPREMPKAKPVRIEGWPMDPEKARLLQASCGPREKVVDLGGGVALRMVRIPAGQFVMGDAGGQPDEAPEGVVRIERAFWMGATEVSNEQFQKFDPAHDPRYYGKRHAENDDQGPSLAGPKQPAVRVSWEGAMAFCRWLSEQSGMAFSLPTEAQWEYACRAGSGTPLSFGAPDADYTPWANLADFMFKHGYRPTKATITGGLERIQLDGSAPADGRFCDDSAATEVVGSRQPNAWGLHDMHGNAAEWTRSMYRAYPYRDDDGRNDVAAPGRRVVRGGSFFDPPKRCRSAHRLEYPAWQRVFNVGFRVVAEEGGANAVAASHPPAPGG